jgi:hypothetical protein
MSNKLPRKNRCSQGGERIPFRHSKNRSNPPARGITPLGTAPGGQWGGFDRTLARACSHTRCRCQLDVRYLSDLEGECSPFDRGASRDRCAAAACVFPSSFFGASSIIAVAVDGPRQAVPARRAAIDLNRHPRDQCAMAITRLGAWSAGLASEGARKLFKKAIIAWRSTDGRDSYARVTGAASA